MRDASEIRARAGDLLAAYADGVLTAAIDRVVPLRDAPLARFTLDSRQSLGKLLLALD